MKIFTKVEFNFKLFQILIFPRVSNNWLAWFKTWSLVYFYCIIRNWIKYEKEDQMKKQNISTNWWTFSRTWGTFSNFLTSKERPNKWDLRYLPKCLLVKVGSSHSGRFLPNQSFCQSCSKNTNSCMFGFPK